MHPELFRFHLFASALPLRPLLAGLAVLLALLTWQSVRWLPPLTTYALGILCCASGLGTVLATNWSLEPQAVTVTSFGVLLSLGLVGGGWLTLRHSVRRGLPESRSLQCTVWCCAAGLICAQMGPLDQAWLHWGAIDSVRHGVNSEWNVLLPLVAAAAVARVYWRDALQTRVWLDAAAPAAPMALALFHLGTYLYGSHHGVQFTNPSNFLGRLGQFPRWQNGLGSPAWLAQVDGQQLSASSELSRAVHPTQLYSAVASLLLLASTWGLVSKQRFQGQVFLQVSSGLVLLEIGQFRLLASTDLRLHTIPPQLPLFALVAAVIGLWRSWGTAPLPLRST